MKKRRLNKILGTILAITLPLTLIGIVAIMFAYPQQTLYKENGLNMWNMHSIWNNNMHNGHMNNGHMGNMTYDGVNKIDLNTSSEEVYIQKSNNNSTYIEYNGSNTPRISQRGDTLTINSSRRMGMMNRGTLTIYVANSIELDIDSGAANITIQDLNLANLQIDGGAGNINLKSLAIKDTVDIQGGVGNINIAQTTTDALDIEMGIGSVDINTLNAKTVDIEGGIGKVKVSNSTINTLSIETGLGSVDISKDNKINNYNKH